MKAENVGISNGIFEAVTETLEIVRHSIHSITEEDNEEIRIQTHSDKHCYFKKGCINDGLFFTTVQGAAEHLFEVIATRRSVLDRAEENLHNVITKKEV